ncbi:hypothetical protein DSO57_1005927 [Entomophthora muscae]|uniref:Uncharacterized protein n=1 Tax=Entomophthora muscae TaxID=34485 RepID=A0ACC2RYW7_9FUNG|nr:hypothetical protein DSO57_1005927 [Entomophthora muscae]
MEKFLLAFLVLPAAIAETPEACILQLFERCREKFPAKGCAVFGAEPTTPHPTLKYNWTEYKDQCSEPFGHPYFIVAILKRQKLAWIIRAGDGGFENWRFDSNAFDRSDKKITIKNRSRVL